MNRRGFFAALVALPFVGKFASKALRPGARSFLARHYMSARFTAAERAWVNGVKSRFLDSQHRRVL